MATSTLSRSLYEQAAEQSDGQSARELAQTLRARAEELRSSHDIVFLSEDTKQQVRETLGEHAPQEELSVAGKDLDDAAEAMERTVGATNAKSALLGANIAGQAQLGQAGTDTFDPRKIEGSETLVDEDMAEGVAAHEKHHTEQRQPDAEQVTLANGQTVTAHEFLEGGAIEAQEGKGVDKLSADYQAIRKKLTGLLPREEFLSLSKAGKLQEFARRTYTQAA